jgi:hypothetical protein
MNVKKTFKGQESLSSQPCLEKYPLENAYTWDNISRDFYSCITTSLQKPINDELHFTGKAKIFRSTDSICFW